MIFALDRQGVIDVIHGDTGANTFTAAGKAGYLVSVGPIRVGPIAGLTFFTRSSRNTRNRRPARRHDGRWAGL